MTARAHARTKVRRTKVRRTKVRRTPLLVGGAVAVVVLVTSFPAATLLEQHSALASARTQLQMLNQQNAALAQRDRALVSGTELQRIARQDYQLVEPGQTLYGILPPAGHAPLSSGTAGDPGNAPLVAPGGALVPPAAPATHPGTFARLLRRLEFWK